MILIKIRCKGEVLNFIRKPIISAGDVNTVRCKFVFDSSWDGFTKKAVFSVNNKYNYQQNLVDDECYIPQDALANKCKLYIGVIGVKNGKTITSRQLLYEIIQGASDGTTPISTDKIQTVVRDYCTQQNYATKTYVDSKQFEPDEETVKEYVQEYCENEGIATQDYVDSAIENIDCPCSPDNIQNAIDTYATEKNLATKTYVDDTVNAAMIEMADQEEPLTVVLNGGDADPTTTENNDEIINFIFNGGTA